MHALHTACSIMSSGISIMNFLKAFDVPRYCVNRVNVLSKLKALCVEITIFHFPSQYLQLCGRETK